VTRLILVYSLQYPWGDVYDQRAYPYYLAEEEVPRRGEKKFALTDLDGEVMMAGVIISRMREKHGTFNLPRPSRGFSANTHEQKAHSDLIFQSKEKILTGRLSIVGLIRTVKSLGKRMLKSLSSGWQVIVSSTQLLEKKRNSQNKIFRTAMALSNPTDWGLLRKSCVARHLGRMSCCYGS